MSPFLALRKADIVLVSSPASPQKKLFGAISTHAALYMGGDSNGNGTPIIAEAVDAGEAFGLGEVRTLPLEISTVYQYYPTSLSIYRPISDLPRSQRDAIVNWAQATAARGLPYWNVHVDMIRPIFEAWLLWGIRPRPNSKIAQLMNQLANNTRSVDKFICSTLVWRAYLEGTGGALDLSKPNNMTASKGSILGSFISDPTFIDQLRPNFIVPDTFFTDTVLLKKVR